MFVTCAVIFVYMCIILAAAWLSAAWRKRIDDNSDQIVRQVDEKKVIVKLLYGKTAIVTGANSGIGFYTALELARRGARVLLACRDEHKAGVALRHIRSEVPDACLYFRRLDLASLQSVRAFCQRVADEEERIDVLVNNAGAIYLGNHITADGLQITWQVNYFAPFLLTNLLVDKVRCSKGKVINVTGALREDRAQLAALNAYANVKHTILSDLLAYVQAKSALHEWSHVLASRIGRYQCAAYVYDATPNSSNFWRRVHMGLISLIYFWLHLLFPRPHEEAKNIIEMVLSDHRPIDLERYPYDECLGVELCKVSSQLVNLDEQFSS